MPKPRPSRTPLPPSAPGANPSNPATSHARHLAAVVEVQLAIDPQKRRRWLTYHVAAADRHGIEAIVIVVTPSARVASWASEPISIGPHGSFAPLVLGPDTLPRPSELPELERSPELALLSTLAHPSEATEASLRALMQALVAVDGDRASLYHDLLYATFGGALARAVEGLMINGEPLSDWAKKHYREGKAEGKAEGIAAGKAEALVAVLAARSLMVSPEDRRTIVACVDSARLDHWLARAIEVESVVALLSEK